MTWDRKNNRYLLKFCLHLHKEFRGIPSETYLNEDLLQDCSIPFTKDNVLSVACQFYDPTGLVAPLRFSACSLSSKFCRDRNCSMNSVLSEVRAEKFCTAVHQILKTSKLSFPRQVPWTLMEQPTQALNVQRFKMRSLAPKENQSYSLMIKIYVQD